MGDVFSLSKSEAHRRGLIDRLELSQKKEVQKNFLQKSANRPVEERLWGLIIFSKKHKQNTL